MYTLVASFYKGTTNENTYQYSIKFRSSCFVNIIQRRDNKEIKYCKRGRKSSQKRIKNNKIHEQNTLKVF